MRYFTGLLFLIFTISIKAQETFPVNGAHNENHIIYAFTNATIYVDHETVLEKATLLVQDGKVLETGKEVKIPQGAVVSNLNGKFIYPGFIDPYTNYGSPKAKKSAEHNFRPQMESNTKGAFGWNQAIKSEVNAAQQFVANNKEATELREIGFGAVLTSSMDGIARGSAAIVTLADKKENEVIVKNKAAALYSFNKGSSTQDYPSSQMGAIALLRQTYHDAQWYASNKNKKETNLSLEAWNNLQNLPQIFETTDKLEAFRADKLGDEFGIQYIIKGSGDEYQRAKELLKTRAKFIIPVNYPKAYDVEDPYDALHVTLADMKHWELAPYNAAYLEKEGVEFAFTSDNLKDKKDFINNVRIAVKKGLKEKTALKALTYTPAKLLQVEEQLGHLKKGATANFIVYSGNLFEEESILLENWIQGEPYIIHNLREKDVRGTYDLTINSKAYELKVDGKRFSPKAEVSIKDDSTKIKTTLTNSNNQVTMVISHNEEIYRLSGNVKSGDKLSIVGEGQDQDGSWFKWKAERIETFIDSSKKSVADSSKPGDIIYPFCAYGKPYEKERLIEKAKTRWDAILIKDVTVWTNEEEGVLKEQDVYITEGRIVRIADDITPTKGAFAKIIDGKGKHLTPGIIDEHSHIAISKGVNEGAQASSAEVRIGDVVNSEDVNIYRQLAGGVTTSQLLHGSANPIGGQSAIVKWRWGKTPEELKFHKADGFIKFALGENVKQSNWGDFNTVRFPQTRMGVEQVYYDHFIRAKEYEQAWQNYNDLKSKEKANTPTPRKDTELDALVEILNKKRFITCHSYVQSEINMLMHVGDSMGFRVNTFTHILEGYKVADKMKAHGAGGSTFSDWWAYKMEVNEAIPYNAAILDKMGIVTAINSDDAEMGRRLNQEAAKAIKYGDLSEEEALKLVTLNPAKLLHIDHKVGSIKPGKDADVVLWSDHPLSVYAKAEKTIIDGIIYFDADEDQKLRKEIAEERTRLINKMIEYKKNGGATQKPHPKKKKLYECETMGDEEYE